MTQGRAFPNANPLDDGHDLGDPEAKHAAQNSIGDWLPCFPCPSKRLSVSARHQLPKQSGGIHAGAQRESDP